MNKIVNNIQDIVFKLYKIKLDNIEFLLSNPPKEEFWDFCLNCFALVKDINKNPNEICKDLELEFKKYPDFFIKTSTEWGYLNFFINKNIFIESILNLNLENKSKNNKNIIIDYIWANVWKPLHIGHLCTPSLGQIIINTYRYLWYNVIWDNHWWDWGGIFGKLIAAFKLNWNPDEFKKDPIEYLLKLYIDITTKAEKDEKIEKICRDEFKKLSKWDKENIKLWQEFLFYSIKQTNEILKLINVKPDYNIWESFYEWLNLPKLENCPDLKYNMQNIVQDLLDKWIATKNKDWSVWIIFPEETKLPSTVLQKSDWTWLYITSDLACIKYRLTNWWDPSEIIYFTDIRQSLHFKQVFWIVNKVWPELIKDKKLYHVGNWFIKLKEWVMSTRKWLIVRLEDLIKEWFVRTKKILEEKWKQLNAEDIQSIAIWAIQYSYLSSDREKDIVFDWDKALNFEWNSWPYIQYTFVRAKKILEKIGKIWSISDTKKINILKSDINLIKKIFEFEKIILQTISKYKPHILAQYCYELSKEFNNFYTNTPKIIEEKDENIKIFRLYLVQKFTQTLKLWFNLLSINMPEEM